MDQALFSIPPPSSSSSSTLLSDSPLAATSFCRPSPFLDPLPPASASISVSFCSLHPFRAHSSWMTPRIRSWKSPSAAALMENPTPAKQDFYTVGEFMTKVSDLFVVKPSTTVDEALEVLVHNRVTGLPVVDDSGKLVGVVSDFDLLALDSISGKRATDASLFPEADSTWKAFKELQSLLSKTQGRTVGEVMTPSPLVVREMTNLEDAARLLLETKYRRLPVVDNSGKLLGLLTRGNVIRAALKIKRESQRRSVS